MTRLNDHQVRKLPSSLRWELFSYVPRKRVEEMDLGMLREHLSLFGRYDLYEQIEEALRVGYVPRRGRARD